MTDLAGTCAELATLTPLLGPALRRDNTGGGRFGRLEVTLSLFNTDVLYARNRIMYEIPAAAFRCCQILNEPWQWRTIGACLIALPRYADRMETLGLAAEHKQLTLLTRSWVLQVKRALGLRKPDIGPLGDCPRCETYPPGQLWMAGAEASLNPHDLTAPPQWRHDPRVYCTLSTEDDPHVWPEPRWAQLILLIEEQHAARLALADHGPHVV